MKLDISKWNPFKFVRKSAEEKRADPANAEMGAAQPAAWPDISRFMIPDPLRMMQHLFAPPLPGFSPTERWFGDFSPRLFQPRLDIVDEGEALRLTAELPGMDRKDVEVLVEDEYLILRGEKKLESQNEEKGCYRLERAFGSFQRAIPLPDGIDPDRAQAKFENGTLTLRIPKTEEPKFGSRRIEIK